MIGVFHPGTSIVHRAPALVKLAALATFVTAIALIGSLAWLGAASVLVVVLFAVARVPLALAWRQVVPILWVLAFAAPLQVLFGGWETAAVMAMRLVIARRNRGALYAHDAGARDPRRDAGVAATVPPVGRLRPGRARARAHDPLRAAPRRPRAGGARGAQGARCRGLGPGARGAGDRAVAAHGGALGEALTRGASTTEASRCSRRC